MLGSPQGFSNRAVDVCFDVTLAAALRSRVLSRLGVDLPGSADLGALRTIYRAWCARVPFDNLRKMIALSTGDSRPLPAMDATDFFKSWLRDGCGGTCWPTSNALFELVTSLGFVARRVAGSMRDCGVVNHGSVKVAIDGQDWLIDSSMLTNAPLPLGAEPFANGDRVFGVEIDPGVATPVIWFDVPPHADYYPCRILLDPVDGSLCDEMYSRSHTSSPFNSHLYARRNYPGRMEVLRGPMRFTKTSVGVEERMLTPDEVCTALHDEIGISDALIAEWVNTGGLRATFAPREGLPPPPLTAVRPSQRNA